jgi:putative membrane protein
MANSTTNRRERSLPKGLLAGLLGGIVGAGVLLVAEEIFPPYAQQESPLPALLTGEGQAPPAAFVPPSSTALQGKPIQWALGAAAGGIYGMAAEMEPSLAAWRGAAFGITLNRLTQESLLPRMGMSPSPEEQSTKARVSGWISHAAYGIATDSVRRLLRRLL